MCVYACILVLKGVIEMKSKKDRNKCEDCGSIQLYTRNDGIVVCKKCGFKSKNKESK